MKGILYECDRAECDNETVVWPGQTPVGWLELNSHIKKGSVTLCPDHAREFLSTLNDCAPRTVLSNWLASYSDCKHVWTSRAGAGGPEQTCVKCDRPRSSVT